MIRQYEAQLRDKQQELNNIANQEKQKCQSIRERAEAVIGDKIQTTLREQYQLAMNMLINNGRTQEAARNEAFDYFVKKMVKPMEEKAKEETRDRTQGIKADIDRITSNLLEVDNELRMLEGN